MWHETSIKIDKAHEFPQLAYRGRLWEITNGLHLVLEGVDTGGIQMMAQKVQSRYPKEALGYVNEDAMVS